MSNDKTSRFADPHDFKVPAELEGWEEMYPSHQLFSSDREEWEKNQFWFQDKIHAPEAMPPLDHIFQEAWQISLSQYTTRVFCIPPAQGIAQRMVGCYLYICAIAPLQMKFRAQRQSVLVLGCFLFSKTMTSCGISGW